MNPKYNTDLPTRRRVFRFGLALAAAGALYRVATAASAQTLSPPAGSKTGSPPPTPLDFVMGQGQGPGVHGANSLFPPLAAREDVVAWSTLTSVKSRREKNRYLPKFTLEQMALNQKIQRIQGFMMPLDPGASQTHFLLSAVPLTCPFCIPGGPESMIEVKSKKPVKYSMEPVVVEGRFLVLTDDAYGLYYRITDASSVK